MLIGRRSAATASASECPGRGPIEIATSLEKGIPVEGPEQHWEGEAVGDDDRTRSSELCGQGSSEENHRFELAEDHAGSEQRPLNFGARSPQVASSQIAVLHHEIEDDHSEVVSFNGSESGNSKSYNDSDSNTSNKAKDIELVKAFLTGLRKKSWQDEQESSRQRGRAQP